MPQIEQSVTINRPIGEVFRFVADFDNNAQQWQPDIFQHHQTEDKLRVGVMITQSRTTRLLGWRLDLNADITGYQPNKLIEYKGVLGRFPTLGRIEFSGAGGSTTVTERMDIRLGCLFAPFSPLMTMVMTGRTRRVLGKLKQMLESRSPGSQTPTDFHQEL